MQIVTNRQGKLFLLNKSNKHTNNKYLLIYTHTYKAVHHYNARSDPNILSTGASASI